MKKLQKRYRNLPAIGRFLEKTSTFLYSALFIMSLRMMSLIKLYEPTSSRVVKYFFKPRDI